MPKYRVVIEFTTERITSDPTSDVALSNNILDQVAHEMLVQLETLSDSFDINYFDATRKVEWQETDSSEWKSIATRPNE